MEGRNVGVNEFGEDGHSDSTFQDRVFLSFWILSEQPAGRTQHLENSAKPEIIAALFSEMGLEELK